MKRWKDKTRDGTPVRIYATDAGGEYPIHGAFKLRTRDEWCPNWWTASGESADAESEHYLMPAEPERVVIENVRFERRELIEKHGICGDRERVELLVLVGAWPYDQANLLRKQGKLTFEAYEVEP